MFIQCLHEAMLILEETTGLGQMGHGMAKNLRQKICDRKSGKLLSLSSTTSTPLVWNNLSETSAVLGPLLQLNAKER